MENNNMKKENTDLIEIFEKISKSDLVFQENNSLENRYDYLSNLFLYLLSHLQNLFYEKYEKDFYEIYADIISFIKNPNCSCKSKIINYVKNNRKNVKKIIFEWISLTEFNENTHNKIVKILNKINFEIDSYNKYLKYQGEPEEESIINSMVGKVVSIENTPDSYYDFIQYLKTNNFHFSGLNVIEIENKLKIYFY